MRPSELLTSAFLLSISALGALCAPRDPVALIVLATLVLGTILLARVEEGPLRVVRDFFPVAVVLATFLVLEPVIAGVNPRRWDDLFSAWDERWLGQLVSAWRGAFGRSRAFVDVNYAIYLSYYFLPLAAAIAARNKGPEQFERAVFAIVLCFYASYVGYFVFPTSGPRLPHSEEARVLGGGVVSELARAFLRSAERNQLDAFPSGHTAIALVAAALGARVAPRAAVVFAAWAAAIVFSTVYIHVHYAIDVIAGVVLAVGVFSLSDRLARAPEPRAFARWRCRSTGSGAES